MLFSDILIYTKKLAIFKLTRKYANIFLGLSFTFQKYIIGKLIYVHTKTEKFRNLILKY